MKHPLYTVGAYRRDRLGEKHAGGDAGPARCGGVFGRCAGQGTDGFRSGPDGGYPGFARRACLCEGMFGSWVCGREGFCRCGAFGSARCLGHPAVYRDFEHWRLCAQGPYAVFESAILFESGGDRRCDTTVAVCIPQQVRIERTMARDGLSREQVLARMERQMSDLQRAERADMVVTAVDFPEKEREADRLDALFRLRAREAAR